MAFSELIVMKKSSKSPKEGDVFVLQPQNNIFYFGKVIQTNLKSEDSFINGMTLIYIYNYRSDIKIIPYNLEEYELLIAPLIVNNQPWKKGYFETITNMAVSEKERKIEFAFWDVVKEEYVDIDGKVVKHKPQYCGVYGLGSYGVVGRDVQKAIRPKNH